MNRGGRCLSLCGNRQLGFRVGDRLEAAGFYDRTFEAVRFFARQPHQTAPVAATWPITPLTCFPTISTPSFGEGVAAHRD
jgi:hypothetical protein